MGATTTLHDPWSPHHAHFSPHETASLLALLETDYFIDSHAKQTKELALLRDLLTVDTLFERHENSVDRVNSPHLKKVIFDLITVDQEVDGAKIKSGNHAIIPKKHTAAAAIQQQLNDPYAPNYTAAAFLQEYMGIYSTPPNSVSPELQLRSNTTMMELLAVDESVDDTKRYHKLVHSSEYGMIEELHEVDVTVGEAKSRVSILDDFKELLAVDCFVDGKKFKSNNAQNNNIGNNGGKRSIFSVKEKYHAGLK